MKPAWLASVLLAHFSVCTLSAAELTRSIAGLDYAKSTGLVAAAFQGGQVLVWELESGKVKNVLNTFGLRTNWNRPLAHFSPDGRRIAFTTDGDAGLVVHDLQKGTSSAVIPKRMLYLGIAAFRWSSQEDTLLVAIGREVVLVNATGRIVWQRRLETQGTITDVVWHPDEHLYTVATDDTTVSIYDTISGQMIATNTLAPGVRGAVVKVGWSKDGSMLVASVAGKGLSVLNADTLKTKKSIACNCAEFDWNPARRELAATGPAGIALYADLAQKAREVHAAEGSGAVAWADGNSLLTATTGAGVAVRESRSGRILKTLVAEQVKQ